MALLYKQLSPLHGVWKMEESSDELLGMLEHKADYSSFLERVSAEKRRQERFASRVLLKELLGEEARIDYILRVPVPCVRTFIYKYISYERLCGGNLG